MNINQYQQLSHSEKIDFLHSLAKQLGPDWTIDKDYLSYQPTQELFAFIPGGQMTMGFSIDSLFTLCKARGEKYKDDEWSWAPNIQAGRPATDIVVYPFLIALVHENDTDMQTPFHLPSEAEMEWLLRNAGQVYFPGLKADQIVTKSNRTKLVCNLQEHFGLEELVDDIDTVGQQCEDSRHETYHQRPVDSLPWGHDQMVKRIVHTTWQDDAEEIIAWHAADRQFDMHGRRRKTLRLPHLPTLKPEVSIPKDYGFFIDAIESGKGVDYEAAWATLQLLSYAPGKDMHGILIYILKKQLIPNSKNTLTILQWLFTLGYGHTPEQLFKNQDAYSEDRHVIRELISTEIDQFIPFLSDKKAEVRSQAALILSMAASESGKARTLLESQFNLEKKVEVKETLLISMALLTRKPLNPDLLEKSKIPDAIHELINTITGKADKQKIVLLIKNSDTLPYFDWFIHLLSSGEQQSAENNQAALELASHALITKSRDIRLTCLRVSLSLLFEKKSSLLLPEQISEPQKKLIELLTPEQDFKPGLALNGLLKEYQIPDDRLAREVILGRSSNSIFAKYVEYSGRSMPLLCALDHAYCEHKRQGLKEFINSFSLIDIVQIRHQIYNYMTISMGVDIFEDLLENISSASEEQRLALCEWLKPLLLQFFETSYIYEGLPKDQVESLSGNERRAWFYLDYYYAAAKNDHFIKSISEKFLIKLLTEKIRPDVKHYKLLPIDTIGSSQNYNIAQKLLESISTESDSYRQTTLFHIALVIMFEPMPYKLLQADEYSNFQKQIIPRILKLLETVSLNFSLIRYGFTLTSLKIINNNYQGILAKIVEFDGAHLPLYFLIDKLSDNKKNHYESIYNLLKNFDNSDIEILKKEIKNNEWRNNLYSSIQWEKLLN